MCLYIKIYIFRKILFITKMNELINQIDKLKQIQQFPRYHLSKYFDELKTKVDLKYALKLDEKEKYLEIIKNIETFEQNAYNKWNSKSINTFDNEINLIEEKLKNNLNITDVLNLIDEVKFKIEKILFSNRSILFIDEKSSASISSFLLIVNDEFISTERCNYNNSDYSFLTREKLNDFILKEKLKKTITNYTKVLNIGILNLKKIDFSNEKIKEIHPNFFNGLTNLKEISFSNNQIKEIHPNLFNGLANLTKIDFRFNLI